MTDISSSDRANSLAAFQIVIEDMLAEKEAQYGRAGGFYDTNVENYDHAIGEVILKLKEFQKTKSERVLVKAATWLYLIYETEALRGPV